MGYSFVDRSKSFRKSRVQILSRGGDNSLARRLLKACQLVSMGLFKNHVCRNGGSWNPAHFSLLAWVQTIQTSFAMSTRLTLVGPLCLAGIFFVSACVSQEENVEAKKWGPENQSNQQLVTEVEPGVWLYGQQHRFSEVGNCNMFDVSPDGKTIAFSASGQIKLFDLEKSQVIETIQPEPGTGVSRIDYSPDGRHLFATAQKYDREKGQLAVVQVIDAITLEKEGTLSSLVEDEEEQKKFKNFYIQNVSVSPDANFVAFSSHDAIQIRDVKSGELVYSKDKFGYIQGMMFTPDEGHLLVRGNIFQEVDLSTGESSRSPKSLIGRKLNGYSLCTSYSKNLVASNAGTGVSILDLESEKVRMLKMPKGQSLQQVECFSDDGSLLAARSWHQGEKSSGFSLVVFDVESGRVKKEIKVPSNGLQRVRFSTDNRSLFVCGHGIYSLLEFDLESDANLDAVKQYPKGPAQGGFVTKDGLQFVTGSADGQLTWFDKETGEVTNQIQKGGLKSIVTSPDSESFLVLTNWGRSQPLTKVDAGDAKELLSFRSKTKQSSPSVFAKIRQFAFNKNESVRANQNYPLDAAWNPEGAEVNALRMSWKYRVEGGFFESKSYSQEMGLEHIRYDAESGAILDSHFLTSESVGFPKNQWIQMGAVHPNGDQILISHSNTLFVVDPQSSETLFEIDPENQAYVSRVAYSPNGQLIAACTYQGVKIYKAEDGEEVFASEKKPQPHFAFSRDGRYLAVAPSLKNSPIKIYSTKTWKPVFERKKSVANRGMVSLSANGETMLVGLTDCRMELVQTALK